MGSQLFVERDGLRQRGHAKLLAPQLERTLSSEADSQQPQARSLKRGCHFQELEQIGLTRLRRPADNPSGPQAENPTQPIVDEGKAFIGFGADTRP